MSGKTLPAWVRGTLRPPIIAGIYPTTPPIPNPLSRNQLLMVPFSTPPAPASATKPPTSDQSTFCGIAPKLTKPFATLTQVAGDTNTTPITSKNSRIAATKNHCTSSIVCSILAPKATIATVERNQNKPKNLIRLACSGPGISPMNKAVSAVAAALAHPGQPNWRNARTE